MVPDVRGVLLTEGSSDEPLSRILEVLCVRSGAREVVVRWVDFGRLGRTPGHTVIERIRHALEAYPDTNLAFVHRDSDGRPTGKRRAEIAEGVGEQVVHVAVVPVQETEAWLLASGEAAIRRAAGHPRGRSPLRIPAVAAIESRAQPKELLREIVERAQDGLARRHRPSFEVVRRSLLERLDLDGGVRELPAFDQLSSDVRAAIERLE